MEPETNDSDAASEEDSDTQDSDNPYGAITARNELTLNARRRMALPNVGARNTPIIFTDATAVGWTMMIQDNTSGAYQLRRLPMGVAQSTTSVVREIAAMMQVNSIRQLRNNASDPSTLDTLESGASDGEASVDSDDAMHI